MYKYFFISIVAILLESCGASQVQKQLGKDKRLSGKEFAVISSEIKTWVGGVKGVKGYSLELNVSGSNLDKMIIDSIWFYKDKAVRPSFILKNDLLEIKGSYSESKNIVFRDVKTGETKSAEKSFKSPILYDGDALIRAYYRGEEKYIIIDSLIDVTSKLDNEFK